ncbi:meiosis 1 arrest protein isoform X1 [Astyanax mexicanus]|uniref:Meiosis 1 arrest protein isoform X1 n=1 Tax=Astyanax mexicanus TaxID=7994 RepID=A0A8B9JNN1_ASTMX|nr:meiosis 1 arrest protein isoform X1 [Astyanax mexicanus]
MSGRNRYCPSASQVCRASSFTRQPPRVLIVDTSPPWWSETCSVLCEALENFLALASTLEGPSRVPLLSLYAVSLQQECLLPFVQVKGNLARLHSCVEELRSLPKEGCTRPRAELLRQAVLDSLQQYKHYTHHATQGNDLKSSSVEVTVLTSQSGQIVLKQLEQSLKDSDLVNLRRLLVVHIAVEQNFPEREPSWSPEPTLKQNMDEQGDYLMLGAEMDVQLVENSVVAVENVLKAWLHDQTGEREHLQLFLPAFGEKLSSKTNTVHRPNPVCIKCDMQERLVSPALLPGTPDLGAKTESLRDFQPTSKSLSNQSPPPQRLRVIKALRADGVCQSVLYGLPLIIRPTTCWQLDWDEMENNQQTFHALCHTLRTRYWFLLVRSELEFGSGSRVFSYYVLQPSTSLSLLLKPVLTRELMLPCNLPFLNEDPSLNALTMVEMCLEQLEEDPVFNPLCLRSNLYTQLRMRGLLSRPYTSHSESQSQGRGQRRDNHRPAEGSTSRQQGRVRATIAPLASAPPGKMSRPPLTLSHSSAHAPSLCRQ